ncbi:MAG: hypothetical protein CML36_04915, partial [Rhodobacteraceae bacterium]|nr:hypothetical protein [Paracoccaceae bacterium]
MVKVIELAKSGAYDQALKTCKKIKKNHSYNALYYNIAGIVCRRLDLFDEALINSRRAFQIDKSMFAAKMNIASIELQKGNVYEAIALLEEIITEKPSYQEARVNLATAYKSAGKLDKSLQIYKNLEFHGPWSLKARFNHGTTLITNQEFEYGWRYYEYRWKTSPQNNVIWPFQDKPVWKGEKGKRVALWREQ